MRAISTEGLEQPKSLSAGATPRLEWLPIGDLVVDSSYQRPIDSAGRSAVERIAQSFSWCCFSPIVVAPVEGGKFAVIDGRRRTTAAALAGFELVPCQIVIANREQQAGAFKAINGKTTTVSRMRLHAAALVANEGCAVTLANICARAGVELLRYPVPVKRQVAGQTMAVGAIAQCFKRYGEETLITALQCVTQTVNNKPGMLSAFVIKAICEALDADQESRDKGLALLEAFDQINLVALARAASVAASAKKIRPSQAMSDLLQSELSRRLANKPTQTEPRRKPVDVLGELRPGLRLRGKILAKRIPQTQTS